MCSTPFGIYEVGTAMEWLALEISDLCSTPFGIYEVGTDTLRTLEGMRAECSTPFGIYEVGTRVALLARTVRIKVLNAFRHL